MLMYDAKNTKQMPSTTYLVQHFLTEIMVVMFQLFFFTGILTTNIMHAVVIIEVQKHLNYKNMIKLTVSWLLEVNICVAERTSCDHVTTNTD